MEVMLEIYRTLKALHMEWKPKESSSGAIKSEKEANGDESGGGAKVEVEEPKKRRRREEEERVKKAQELYFVETRCRMDDVMVCSSRSLSSTYLQR
jgi:carbon catabolite-derepressing protein kinase